MRWEFLKKSTYAKENKNSVYNNFSIFELSLEYLKQLIPIGDLPIETLRNLNISLRNFMPGEIIFSRGDLTETICYLKSGQIFVEIEKDYGYTLDAGTFKALHPISTSKQYKFNCFAKTQTSVIYVPINCLHERNVYLNNPLINPANIPKALQDCALFTGICSSYQKNELRIPSLPDVALRLRRALQKEISIADSVKIINLDPVISSKLIQIVNSPMYRTLEPAKSCFDAVNRLGLKTCQNIATSISLNSLFISSDKQLHEKIQALWKQTIYIAALSYTLANLSKRLDPDEALLAGLVNNIGSVAIIAFAETLNKAHYTEQELDQCIAILEPQLSISILKSWDFPEIFLNIPLKTNNWFYDDDKNLQLHDLVLLAKYHSLMGSAHKKTLPPIHTISAFEKLGDNELTADLSLKALSDAKQQISETLLFFKI